MFALLPWAALSSVALVVLLVASRNEGRAREVIAAVAKVVASAGFLGAAISAGALDTFYGKSLLLALGWAALGDVLLIPRSKLSFVLGIFAFLVGHIGYVVVFRMRGSDDRVVLASLAPLVLLAAVVLRWLRPHVAGAMRFAVLAYVAVITTMVAFAVGTTWVSPAALPMAAAVLFFISDLFVARHRFVQAEWKNRAIGLPLYYAAQFLFVGLLIEYGGSPQ